MSGHEVPPDPFFDATTTELTWKRDLSWLWSALIVFVSFAAGVILTAVAIADDASSRDERACTWTGMDSWYEGEHSVWLVCEGHIVEVSTSR